MVRSSILSVALCVALSHPGARAEEASGTTTIAGATYRFPDAAFADGEIEHGRQGDILLAVTWPGMDGVPLQPGGSPEPEAQLQILANSDAEDGARASDAKLGRAITRNALVMADMDPRHPPMPLRPVAKPPAGSPIGLVPVTMDRSNPLGGDLYVKPPVDEPVEFIRCDRKGGIVEVPHCSQEFVMDGMLLKVSYPGQYLPDWRKIHDSIKAYFRTHRVNP